jgi:hypothetical protein
MSSVWRKRQISDQQHHDNVESIKQNAKEINSRLIRMQRNNDILISILDVFFLCAGFALCSYSFGVPAGLGLGLLVLFARGEL